MTVRKFIETALMPVGRTMYVYGGGWNREDTGAGADAVTIGVSPRWEEFFREQGSDYDYTKTRYQIHDGLDCSGFVGWAVYNTLFAESGGEGFVTKASEMARFLSMRGLGAYEENPRTQSPGDIISMRNHVYISLGSCADGSALFIHSSPPGVHMCGTRGKAHQLASRYMRENHGEWFSIFPNRIKGEEYLAGISRFSRRVLGDPEGIGEMTAEETVKELKE